MEIKRGTFRIVILVGSLAFKIPASVGSWKGRLYSFLQGWQQNLTERAYSKLKDEYLCPVYFSLFGLVNVMPYCSPFCTGFDIDAVDRLYDSFKRGCSCWYLIENKQSSFGHYGRRIVAIDYGNDCIALQQDKLYRLAPLDAKGMDMKEETNATS